MLNLKELGDVIATETHTDLCPHHRISVAAAVAKWISEQQPNELMMHAAGGALAAGMQIGNISTLGDAFVVQLRGAFAELSKNRDGRLAGVEILEPIKPSENEALPPEDRLDRVPAAIDRKPQPRKA